MSPGTATIWAKSPKRWPIGREFFSSSVCRLRAFKHLLETWGKGCIEVLPDQRPFVRRPVNKPGKETQVGAHAMPVGGCVGAAAMPCGAMPDQNFAMPRHAMPCHLPCQICHAMPCHAKSCRAMPCVAMRHPCYYRTSHFPDVLLIS